MTEADGGVAQGDVVTALAEIVAVEVAGADRGALEGALALVRHVRGWLDAFEVGAARRLEDLGSFPEKVIADANRAELRTGDRIVRRAQTTAQAPQFEDALAGGQVTAGHVDALGRALRRLTPDQQDRLLDDADRLVAAAARSTVEAFARTLTRHVLRLSADGQDGGMDRLARQKAATRVRTWVDPDDGMWCLHGRFDPDTGRRLHDRLEAAIAALFSKVTPGGCPDDPVEKQDHLRGLALVTLLDDAVTGGSGRTETVVVVDTTAPTGPIVDWGLPVEIPWPVLADLFGLADPTVVIVRNGIVLHAPGRLDLGRSTRLANRAQRRALQALYPTCAIPGCGVPFRHTQPHHIVWWEHGGTTDLANLLPLCVRHHHHVHDHGWRLRLGPHRELEILLPDGQVMTTGPPTRRAA